ncbi:MAG: serine/threonine protein kinase [Deltaproteobacteria bacterium]|nr:serine/threonine protein kinase [Deltaproteobacteria bacterium]
MARRRARAARRQQEAPERMLGWIIDDKYRICRVIGEGGMSAIYEAEHLALDRYVALKVLHPVLADDPEAIARLSHEAQVVSTIGHPNICEVFDLGRTADGSPYLVMERLIGESLAERIEHFGPLSFGELAPLLLEILAALEAAHGKGILHRDLKPENVFIVESRATGRSAAKLLDFGISKTIGYDFVDQPRLTHTGMVMGTPYYMAPEQARGDSGLDQRVDLWAVGVILYESLTGRRPFVATNYNALLVRILTSRPRPVQKLLPSIGSGVASLVDKALSKLREDRFQTATEFREAVRRCQRECAATDSHAPTMILRRAAKHQGVGPRRSDPRPSEGRSWDMAIDDPETFIDDDPFDERQLPSGGGDDTHREIDPPMGLDDGIPEPLEPTIQDRLPDFSSLGDSISGESTDADDTEVMKRPAPVPPARQPSPSSTATTDVMDRDALLAQRQAARSAKPKVPRPTQRKRRLHRPPPLPGQVSDDDPTTLYDIDAARAKLRARRRAAERDERSDDGFPEDGNG